MGWEGPPFALSTSTSRLLAGPVLTSFPHLLFGSRQLPSGLLSLSPTFSPGNPEVLAFPLLLPQSPQAPHSLKQQKASLAPAPPLLPSPLPPFPATVTLLGSTWYTHTHCGHLFTPCLTHFPSTTAPKESLIPGHSSPPARSLTSGGFSADLPQVSSLSCRLLWMASLPNAFSHQGSCDSAVLAPLLPSSLPPPTSFGATKEERDSVQRRVGSP